MTSGPTSKGAEVLRILRGLRLACSASPGLVTRNVALVTLQGTLPLAGLVFAARAVDAVAPGTRSQPSLSSALLWIAAAAVVAVALAAASSLAAVSSEALALEVGDHVADLLHRKSVALDLAFYEDPAFHDTLHRAQQDAVYRPASITAAFLQLLQNLTGLLAVALLLWSLRWWMAAALLLAAAPGVVVRVWLSDRLFDWSRQATETQRRAWYYHWLLTNPGQAAESRVLGLGELFRARYADLRKSLREAKLGLGRQRAGAEAVAQGVGAAVIFGIFAFLAKDAVAGAITIGAFVLHFHAFQRGLSSLQAVFGSLAGLREHGLFLTWLEEFLGIEPRIVDPPRSQPFPTPVRKGLVASDLAFGYRNSSAPVIDGLSFRLAPSELVALVGLNGSGKSTLIKLLLRLYDPDRGSITVDGIDLREMRAADVRRNFSVLLQGFGRYAFSARQNVAFGECESSPDDGRIGDAARASGADVEVARLPREWDTVLGNWFQDGRDLSAGQWQKLALARAFYRKAPFIILDEPTASLDPLAERALFEGLRRLVAGRAALFISHHLSTARLADRILVLDAGRLVEQGSHDDLVRAGGLYSRMWAVESTSPTRP